MTLLLKTPTMSGLREVLATWRQEQAKLNNTPDIDEVVERSNSAIGIPETEQSFAPPLHHPIRTQTPSKVRSRRLVRPRNRPGRSVDPDPRALFLEFLTLPRGVCPPDGGALELGHQLVEFRLGLGLGVGIGGAGLLVIEVARHVPFGAVLVGVVFLDAVSLAVILFGLFVRGLGLIRDEGCGGGHGVEGGGG